jgi:hypothetical protein
MEMSFSSPTTTAVVETTNAAQQDERLHDMYNRLVALNQRQQGGGGGGGGVGGSGTAGSTVQGGTGRAAAIKAAPYPPAATAPLTATVSTSLYHRQHSRQPVHVTQSQTEVATSRSAPAAAAATATAASIDLLDDSDDDDDESFSVSDMDIDLVEDTEAVAQNGAAVDSKVPPRQARQASTESSGEEHWNLMPQHPKLMATLSDTPRVATAATTTTLPNHTLAAPFPRTSMSASAAARHAAALPKDDATTTKLGRKRGLPNNSASTMHHARRRHFAAESSTHSHAIAAASAAAATPVASIDLCDDDDDDDVKMPARTTAPAAPKATTVSTMTPGAALVAAVPMAASSNTSTPVWDLTSTAATAASILAAAGIVTVDDDDDDDDVVVEMNPPTFPRGLFVPPPSQRRARRRRRQNPATTGNESSSVAVVNLEFQVLTVFPNACIDHVRSRLAALNQSVAAVLLEMAESKSTYPKNEGQTTSTTLSTATDSVVVHMEQHEATAAATSTTSNVDWMSTESFQPMHLYIEQAKQVLLGEFAFLSVKGATRCLAQSKYHYAVCHEKLLAAIKGDESDTAATTNAVQEDEGQNVQYDRVLAMRTRGAFLDKQQIARVLTVAGVVPTPIGAGNVVIQPYNDRDYAQIFLKNARPKTVTKKLVTDPMLVEEIKYVSGKLQKWLYAQQAARDLARQKQQAQQDGTAMECPCCCDSYPLDQMVQCRDEGHLFCHSCLVSYANNQIFGNDNLGVHKTTKKLSLELQCLQGDCPSYFERSFLERALPPRLLQHYDSVQLKLSIASAGLSDTVCACPKCDFCVEVPVGQNIVQCPVATCRFASCRECGEAAHIPLRYVGSNMDKVQKRGVFSRFAFVLLE